MRVIRAVTVAAVLAAARLCWPAPPIEEGRITPSVVCGTCHRDIYQMWRSSAHAGAMEDVVFFEAYRRRRRRTPRRLGSVSTVTRRSRECSPDPTLAAQATWDGVSCDACHSLVSVELAPGGARQTFEPGPREAWSDPRRGLDGARDAYSALHTSALVCAGCHEFQNARGDPDHHDLLRMAGERGRSSGEDVPGMPHDGHPRRRRRPEGEASDGGGEPAPDAGRPFPHAAQQGAGGGHGRHLARRTASG